MMMDNSVLSAPNLILLAVSAGLAFFHFRRSGLAKFSRKDFSFSSGILLIVLVAVVPGRFLGDGFAMSSGMIKQITLLLIVPPMLLSGSHSSFWERILEKKKVRAVANIIVRTPVTWAFGIGSMWIWELPVLAKALSVSGFVQSVYVVSLLLFGTIFIWPVFAPYEFRKLAAPLRAFYLVSACTGCTVLGIGMTFAPTSWFVGSGSVVDQQVSGLIMWVPACLVYVTNIMISLARWYRAENADADAEAELKGTNISRGRL